MAKCDLSIELDDPDGMHSGGGTVTGIVRVRADADVSCSGLEVRSEWKTHGRGNVTSGTAGTLTLFSGEWRSGETNEYRFELPIADWPPSYHGHYLNVDHYVEARAKIPWAFDPKASAPFQVRPTCGPEGVTSQSSAVEVKGLVGCLVLAFFVIIIGMVIAGMGAALAVQPVILLFVAAIPVIGGLIWGAKVGLPKFLLGDVSCELETERVTPGDSVRGKLVITPRRNVSVNAITLQFLGREKVISGSGSNRTTHTHAFFDNTETLQPATTLTAGKVSTFPFAVTVPEEAPYSLELDDNSLNWSAKLRVDIPRWPDWTEELKLDVVPSGRAAEEQPHHIPATAGESIEASTAAGQPGGQSAITFAETAAHFWEARNDRRQAELLVEAVRGLSFELEAEVERRLLYLGEDAPISEREGYAVWARYPEPPLPLVIYIPNELGDEFEQLSGGRWRGEATIVGWDGQHRRLQLKLDR